MTLDEALAKTTAALDALLADSQQQLADDFAHATSEELAAILTLNRQAFEDNRQRLRAMVTAFWHTGNPSVH